MKKGQSRGFDSAVQVRLPKDMKDALERDAADNFRAVNSHILFILTKHLKINSSTGEKTI